MDICQLPVSIDANEEEASMRSGQGTCEADVGDEEASDGQGSACSQGRELAKRLAAATAMEVEREVLPTTT